MTLHHIASKESLGEGARRVEGWRAGGFKTLAIDVCGAYPKLFWFNSCQPYLEDISLCSDWL